MSAGPADKEGGGGRSAFAEAKERAARARAEGVGVKPPPLPAGKGGGPPPRPTQVYATLAESQAALEERHRVARAATLLDQEEMERFRNLVIFAKTLVESRFQGRHRSPDLGGGGEFAEYLAYEPGRPVEDIDWRVFARSKRLVIRRFREETDMDVHLLVDASGSMAYRGGKREVKGLRGARIAAGLAYLMMRQGDKASLTLFADRVLDHSPSGGTRRHLMALLRSLVQPAYQATGKTDVPGVISEAARLIRRKGRMVILSDFLGTEPGEVFAALAPFIHKGFEVLLMQLTDPDEMSLPDAPLARFVDMETEEMVEVEPSEIRAGYEARMRERVAEFARGAARNRVDYISLDTADPYREAVEAYLGFRERA